MQYRAEIDKDTGKIIRCAQAYDVAPDGVIQREKSVIVRFRAESLAEARALAAFTRYQLKKKGEL